VETKKLQRACEVQCVVMHGMPVLACIGEELKMLYGDNHLDSIVTL